ncbi:HNH endonuclease [Collimonas pratensis]|uniref:HNH endonuclease family protein n=1 Tax=Collimonas pratensis TaxID=279113 RepID=A0ABM5Z3C5_9BURK|nr:HNH endonuclease [Collimonas pratensis]AMP13289.1 HNH endonuclease family protein [Collimonas pratensis]
MSKEALERVHTPPHQVDGIPLACALQTARYLSGQNSLLRIVLWVGHGQDVKAMLAMVISPDVLEPLLRDGAAAYDGFHLELRTRKTTEEPCDAILLAVCIDYAELDSFLHFNAVCATILVPRSEEDLRMYLGKIPDSKAISWSDEVPEHENVSKRTEELSRRIAWYDERYLIIKSDFFGDKNGHTHAKHDGTGRCRYCGKSAPEVTFRSKSHAFPEQIGNKTLIDPAECDACNRHFGKMLDDDFAKWTQPWRTVLRVNGGSGVPTTRSRDQKIRIEATSATNLTLSVPAADERHAVDVNTKRLRILVDRPTYTPMGVFKCLVKMALSVMPEAYASECSHLKKWILETSHTFESYPYHPLNVLLQLIPGPMPNRLISCALLRRKNEASRTPYMMFVLQFANVLLQIALPMHEHDDALLNGETFEILPFPHLGEMKDFESQFGRSELRVLDMSGVERVRDESEPISLQYSQQIEPSGNLPT